MLYIEEGVFDIDPSKQILKAQEYAALLKAQGILDLAHKKARQMDEDAKKAFEEEKERGYNEGMEAGNEKISELMIDAVGRSVKNFEEFENDVIAVVVDALRKILGELDQTDLISRVVRNALEMVRNQKRVTLIVNPSESAILREQLEELLAEFPSINYIDITTDSRIQAGGCKLETEMGVVDATIEVQIESIKRSLTRAIK